MQHVEPAFLEVLAFLLDYSKSNYSVQPVDRRTRAVLELQQKRLSGATLAEPSSRYPTAPTAETQTTITGTGEPAATSPTSEQLSHLSNCLTARFSIKADYDQACEEQTACDTQIPFSQVQADRAKARWDEKTRQLQAATDILKRGIKDAQVTEEVFMDMVQTLSPTTAGEVSIMELLYDIVKEEGNGPN
jgi:hypothetical protein